MQKNMKILTILVLAVALVSISYMCVNQAKANAGYNFTVSYSVPDSSTPTTLPTFTYVDAVTGPQVVSVTTTPTTYDVSPSTSWSLSNPAYANALVRWITNNSTLSGTASSDTVLNPTYYRQFYVTYSYATSDFSTPSPAPRFYGYQYGTKESFSFTTSSHSEWLDAQTVYSFDDPIYAPSLTEEWAISNPASASGQVTGSITVTPSYYHQFQVTFEYSVSDGSPTAPTAYYKQFGGSLTMAADPSGSAFDWVDAGTAVSYTNPISAVGNERWQADFTVSGGESVIVSSVDSSTSPIDPEYYHQVQNTFTVTGISGSDSVVLTGTLFGTGSSTIVTLDSGNGWSASAWSDYNYAVTFPAVSSLSTRTERWAIPSAASTGALTAGGNTYSEAYTHQFKFTLSYSISDSSLPTAPTLTSTQFGGSYTPSLTGTATDYWLDSGFSWAVDNPLSDSAGSERWQTTQTVSGTVSAAQTIAYTYYHQFEVAFYYSFNNGGGLAVPSDPTAYYTQFGSAQTITALTGGATDWVDATTAIQYDNPLSAGANERWQADFTVSGGKSTIVSSVSGSTLSPDPDYFLQVSNAFTVTGVSGSDTVVLTGALYGSSPVTIVTLDTSNGWSTTAWSDRNTAVTFPATSTASTGSERWALSGGATSTGALAAGGGSYSQAYTHQFYVALSYNIANSPAGTGYSDPTVSFTQFGAPASDTATEISPPSDWIDAGTTATYDTVLIGSTGSERWAADPSTVAFTISDATPLDLNYYHQFYVSLSFNIANTPAGVGYGNPTVSFTQYGGSASDTATEIAPPSDWIDAGTAATYDTQLSGSGASVRWNADPATVAITISDATPLDLNYYHQFHFDASYSTSDLSTPSDSVVLSGTQYGDSSFTFALTTSSQDVWLDAGSSWSVNDPIPASPTTERWDANGVGTSGTVTATGSITPLYYHQFSVVFSYSVSDGSPTAPTAYYKQFGSSLTITADSTGSTSDWVDAGTAVSYTNPISASGTERWQADFTVSGGKSVIVSSVDSSTSPIDPEYYHQFHFDASYSTSDLSTPSSAVVLSGIQYGDSSFTVTLTTSPQNVWLDYSTSWSVNDPIDPIIISERWDANGVGTSGTVTTSGTIAPLYYHQFLVSLAYNIANSPAGTGYSDPSVSYTQFGAPLTETATESSPPSDWIDAGTVATYDTELTGSGASERWDADPSTVAITVNDATPLDLNYYHQFLVSLSFNIANTPAGAGYGNPTVTFTQYGASTTDTATESLPPSDWIDAGTSAVYDTILGSSTSSEQWAADPSTASIAINGASPLNLAYYHQFHFDSSYSTSDASTPSDTVTLSGTQYGDTGFTIALTTSSQNVWLDAGSSWSVNDPIVAVSGTERWDANGIGTSGSVSAAGTIAPAYYHQFEVIFQYSVTDGSPTAPTAYYEQFGGSHTVVAATDQHVLEWVDAGTAVSYDNPISASGTERWQADYTVVLGESQIVSSVSGSTLTIDPLYYHQFKVVFEYTVSGGGSPAAPTAYYTQFSGSASMTADSGGGASDWVDAGTAVSYTNPTSDSTSTEQWMINLPVSSGVSQVAASVDSGTSPINPTYVHQFKVVFEYTVSGGGSPAAPTAYYTQFGGSTSMTANSGGSASDWVDAGTAVSYTNPTSDLTSTERWQTNLAISGGESTVAGSVGSGTSPINPTYVHQFLVVFQYTVSGGGSPAAPTAYYTQFGGALTGCCFGYFCV